MKSYYLTFWIISTLIILALGLLPGEMVGRISRTVFSFTVQDVSNVFLVSDSEINKPPLGGISSTSKMKRKTTFFDQHYYQIQWFGHLVFFFVNSLFVILAFSTLPPVRLLILLGTWSIFLGGILEFWQRYLPSSFGRTGGDWWDILSNFVGMLFAVGVGSCLGRFSSRTQN